MKTESTLDSKVFTIKDRRWWKPVLGVLLAGTLFSYGLGVGHYKWPPFWLLQKSKSTITKWLQKEVIEYRGE